MTRTESAGDVHATSLKGAMGLMQIMPDTWAELRQAYSLGRDPYDPHDNILAGAAYLRALYDRYGSPGFLAAYHAGPQRWLEHLATGHPLPDETRLYLARLLPIMDGKNVSNHVSLVAALAQSWHEASLFPARSASARKTGHDAADTIVANSSVSARVADPTALAPQSNGLFVAISTRKLARGKQS